MSALPPLLSSPTHHAHYFLKIWNQTDGQTDRDGGGDGGGGMALPKNGKSPMQKWETKRGSKWWLQSIVDLELIVTHVDQKIF